MDLPVFTSIGPKRAVVFASFGFLRIGVRGHGTDL